MLLKLIKRTSPHIVVILVSIIYILLGAFMFQLIEQRENKKKLFNVTEALFNISSDHLSSNKASEFDSYTESALFSFITLTTIGWGNVSPKSTIGRLFSMLYAAFGIPLVLMAIGDVGKFLNSAIWRMIYMLQDQFHNRFGFHRYYEQLDIDHSSKTLPMYVIVLLVLVHTVTGGLLFMYGHQQPLTFVDAMYFSFISFTTIGYGDFYLASSSIAAIGVVYLILGMALMTTFVTALSDWLNYLHYFGKKVKGAEHAEVWFGNETLSVRELLTHVGSGWGKTEQEMQVCINNLDQTVQEVVDQKNEDPKETMPTRTHRRAISYAPTSSNDGDGKRFALPKRCTSVDHSIPYKVKGNEFQKRKIHPVMETMEEESPEKYLVSDRDEEWEKKNLRNKKDYLSSTNNTTPTQHNTILAPTKTSLELGTMKNCFPSDVKNQDGLGTKSDKEEDTQSSVQRQNQVKEVEHKASAIGDEDDLLEESKQSEHENI